MRFQTPHDRVVEADFVRDRLELDMRQHAIVRLEASHVDGHGCGIRAARKLLGLITDHILARVLGVIEHGAVGALERDA